MYVINIFYIYNKYISYVRFIQSIYINCIRHGYISSICSNILVIKFVYNHRIFEKHTLSMLHIGQHTDVLVYWAYFSYIRYVSYKYGKYTLT